MDQVIRPSSRPGNYYRLTRSTILAALIAIPNLTFGIPTANATLYASNLDTASAGFHIIGNIGSIPYSLSNEFTTGSHSGGYEVSEISIRFHDQYGNPGNLQVGIYDSNSSSPGFSIGSLFGENPVSAGIYTYSPQTSSIRLAPNSPYFLVLQPESVGPSFDYYYVSTTDSPNESSLENWSIADSTMASGDLGTNWSPVTGVIQFSIEATPVPEPSMFAVLVGLSLISFSWLHGRSIDRTSSPPSTDG